MFGLLESIKLNFQQKALFDEGCIYVGVPPLYKVALLTFYNTQLFACYILPQASFHKKYQVDRGKHAHYCYDEAELKHLLDSFPSNASFNIQRFKGNITEMSSHFVIMLCIHELECISAHMLPILLLNFTKFIYSNLAVGNRIRRDDAGTTVGNNIGPGEKVTKTASCGRCCRSKCRILFSYGHSGKLMYIYIYI